MRTYLLEREAKFIAALDVIHQQYEQSYQAGEYILASAYNTAESRLLSLISEVQNAIQALGGH